MEKASDNVPLFSFSPFLSVFYKLYVLVHVKKWKKKGDRQWQRELLSPTENAAPETPRQESRL